MELFLQPNIWSCLPTSFGMVMGFTPKEMFDAIGHDGSQIIWTDLSDPDCRRSFHPQECVIVALRNLFHPVEVEFKSLSVPLGHENRPYEVPIPKEFFSEQLKLISGVLLGLDRDDKPHAVAWCREEQLIYDPVGCKYPLDEFKPYTFFGLH